VSNDANYLHRNAAALANESSWHRPVKHGTGRYQSKGAEDGDSRDAFQAELQQRQGHDDKIEDVPAFPEVEFGAVGQQLQRRLDGERRRKELQRQQQKPAFEHDQTR